MDGHYLEGIRQQDSPICSKIVVAQIEGGDSAHLILWDMMGGEGREGEGSEGKWKGAGVKGGRGGEGE